MRIDYGLKATILAIFIINTASVTAAHAQSSGSSGGYIIIVPVGLILALIIWLIGGRNRSKPTGIDVRATVAISRADFDAAKDIVINLDGRDVNVSLKGVAPNTTMLLTEQGQEREPGGPRGDLYLTLRAKEDVAQQSATQPQQTHINIEEVAATAIDHAAEQLKAFLVSDEGRRARETLSVKKRAVIFAAQQEAGGVEVALCLNGSGLRLVQSPTLPVRAVAHMTSASIESTPINCAAAVRAFVQHHRQMPEQFMGWLRQELTQATK